MWRGKWSRGDYASHHSKFTLKRIRYPSNFQDGSIEIRAFLGWKWFHLLKGPTEKLNLTEMEMEMGSFKNS